MSSTIQGKVNDYKNCFRLSLRHFHYENMKPVFRATIAHRKRNLPSNWMMLSALFVTATQHTKSFVLPSCTGSESSVLQYF